MVIIGTNYKPKGIIIQLRDDVEKKTRSFTVHNMSLNKLYFRLMHFVEHLQQYDEIRLVCYKKGDKICQEKEEIFQEMK